jgi:hypothetical protein
VNPVAVRCAEAADGMGPPPDGLEDQSATLGAFIARRGVGTAHPTGAREGF